MTTSRQTGTALAGSLIITMVLIGVSMTYVTTSYGGYEASNRERDGIRARLASDEGLYLAMAELKSNVDPQGNGLGTVSFTGPDGRDIQTTAIDLGANIYLLHSRGQVPRVRMGGEMVVEVLGAASLSLNPRAAITAEGPVVTLGNITVDGRDHDDTGTTVVGPGGFGISSVNSVSNSGSSTVGGNGTAPANPPGPNTLEAFASWADGVDNDNDSVTDEEIFDGIDNDGDGLIDEDTHDYPSSPDIMFRLPEGTLKSLAQAAGTYFSSESAVNSYIAAHGGNLPGGQIYYMEFDVWQPVDFGPAFNQDPAIIVHHNSTGTARMKNVHGAFKGLVLADFVTHLNGDFVLVGALMSFSDQSIGNSFGNGNANILFSSAVLNGLPSGSSTRRVRIHTWSRASADT